MTQGVAAARLASTARSASAARARTSSQRPVTVASRICQPAACRRWCGVRPAAVSMACALARAAVVEVAGLQIHEDRGVKCREQTSGLGSPGRSAIT